MYVCMYVCIYKERFMKLLTESKKDTTSLKKAKVFIHIPIRTLL